MKFRPFPEYRRPDDFHHKETDYDNIIETRRSATSPQEAR
jgi:hypothetical protein